MPHSLLGISSRDIDGDVTWHAHYLFAEIYSLLTEQLQSALALKQLNEVGDQGKSSTSSKSNDEELQIMDSLKSRSCVGCQSYLFAD